jgi:hypothetical protein
MALAKEIFAMANCEYCGTATTLYDNDIPVCIRCSDAQEHGQRFEMKPVSPTKPVSQEIGSSDDAATEVYF